jgi:hypothetical protein
VTELSPLEMAVYKIIPDVNSIEIVPKTSCEEAIVENKTDLKNNCGSVLN